MLLNSFIMWYMFFMGMIVFCSLRKYLLLTLLSLEYLVVVVFLGFFIFLMNYSGEYYFIIIFLTFSVCEGVLGLSILVSMIRCHGNDNLMNMSSLMW
uniref:NADH-ubiquinone oxidoreductase chain 4L n=1 Tax=Potamometra linnavuorii TaxID=2853722 RepID=A0A8K1N7M5_9HEMI|nr:NADH dehydrogenase subunit 4L [Potamometra macrokosos]UCU06876.1 NADH dehydrogenase subunit 4L [Potamometra linnavuorii]UCU06889.1 NADH dehydrogenase subunit 4L [Potamometra linnavuorii]UJY96844.1 NADH dehydrogenase subunit 4L [Potamometra macrokosos]UJY96857.1 NADH dehydrogenase subunit 4L [Potamometra macrokosos]UJY96870.1 NADH dehydrogenase subunit 4L [Potamometra macrokosos]